MIFGVSVDWTIWTPVKDKIYLLKSAISVIDSLIFRHYWMSLSIAT